MTKLVIHNNYCQIEGETDHSILSELDKELSYFNKNAIFSKLFKIKKWNGFSHLLQSDLKFPSGLFQRVCDFYKNNNLALEISDLREIKSPTNSINILDKLVALGKTPYNYQIEMIEIIKHNDRGILRAATGSGKSITIALITAYFGKSTNIYVIGTDLLHQMHELFSKLFDEEVGIVGDGSCQIKRINIVSVWTAGAVLGLKKTEILSGDDSDDEKEIDTKKYEDVKAMIASSKINIFDECHSASCLTIRTISNNMIPECVYGLSASPYRDDGSDLLVESILGKTIFNLEASTLIISGHLVKPIIKFIDVPPIINEPNSYKAIYKEYIVENPVRNALVIKGVCKLVEQGYVTLLLYNSIKHGEHLYQELKNKVPCALLSGKDDSNIRDEVKKKVESGGLKVILASSIFDLGIDLPILSGLVLAGGGRSSVRAIQRIGRVVRKYPGKTQAAVIDFVDNAKFLLDHSKIRYKIYSSEEQFNIHLPERIKWKRKFIDK